MPHGPVVVAPWQAGLCEPGTTMATEGEVVWTEHSGVAGERKGGRKKGHFSPYSSFISGWK